MSVVGTDLVIALGASLLSAALVTLVYNALHRSAFISRFRADLPEVDAEDPWEMEPLAPSVPATLERSLTKRPELPLTAGRHAAPGSVPAASFDSLPLVSP
jgi:hypothetical protein